MKRKFNLAALPVIDGGMINAAFNRALRRCEEDIRDRPGEDKPRKVVLTVELSPIRDQRARLDTIAVAFDIDDSIPKRRSKTYEMLPTEDGALFDELSPDDAHNGTLAFDEEPADKEK